MKDSKYTMYLLLHHPSNITALLKVYLLLHHPSNITALLKVYLLLHHPSNITALLKVYLLLHHPSNITALLKVYLLLHHPSNITALLKVYLLLHHPSNITALLKALVLVLRGELKKTDIKFLHSYLYFLGVTFILLLPFSFPLCPYVSKALLPFPLPLYSTHHLHSLFCADYHQAVLMSLLYSTHSLT